MRSTGTSYKSSSKRRLSEKRMMDERQRQAGIAYPHPGKQDHVLVIRLNILPINDLELVSQGLKRMCTFFEHIDRGVLAMEEKKMKRK